MATVIEVFNVVEKLEALKVEILRTFEELNKSLSEHKHNLLTRLAKMKEKYEKFLEIEQAIQQMKTSRDNIQLKLTEKVNVENLEFVTFRCFSGKICKAIAETDLIEMIPEYMERENPVLKKCKGGIGNGEFINPRGIAIDRNKNEIYVADCSNCRIQVLSIEGDYLRSFGTDNLKEPFGVCLSQEGVFVSDKARDCLVKFSLAGEFIKETGSRGNTPGCFI